ncbi:MAG: PD-(D/E)XK nuclease family protein [Patescibacteria group bacterium]
MRISYSALDTFNRCPKKYQFQYLERVRVPEKPELFFGSLIHEVVQLALKKDPILPPIEELLAFYKSKWQEEIFSSAAEAKQYFAWGENMIRHFHSSHKPGLRNIVAVEKRFLIPLGDHQLSGMIDRVDKLPFGAFEVIDYKTSKQLPSKENIDQDKQLCMYHLAVEYLWPEAKDIRLTLYFLKHNSQMTTKRRPDEIEEIKEHIIKTAAKIEKETDFFPKANPLCDWCEYGHLCPLQKDKYKDNKNKNKEINKDMDQVVEEYLLAQQKIRDLEPKIHQHFDEEKIERFFGKKGIITRGQNKKLTVRKN